MATQHVIKMKNLKPIPQNTDPTCWVAAYEMMFDWKGKPKDTIPTLMKGAVKDVKDCYDKGLDASDWSATAKAFGLSEVKGKKPFSAEELAGYLSHGPVLVHGKFALGMHSIVVIGVTVADYPWEGEMVTYINPYWVGTKSVQARTSSFKDYLKLGVEANDGKAAVIQYW